jgi:thymidylate kinase
VFLIVEGLHNVGKSTLVSQLQDFKLFECRRTFKELLDAKNVKVSDFSFGVNCSISWFAKNFSCNDVIFDRLHLSEYAYSILFRNVNKQDAMNKFQAIDDILSVADCKMIFLTCRYDVMCQRLETKNKVYNLDDYISLADYFDEVLKKTKILCKVIDTSNLSTDEVLRSTLSFIRR